MPSIMDVFEQVCTHQPPLLTASYQRNIRTSLKYLASAYGTTPEKLAFTPEIEAGYREQIRTYFNAHPREQYTVRNTLNYLSKLWKAFHTLDQTPPVPKQVPRVPSLQAARERLKEASPYRHLGWLQGNRYGLPPERWPGDMPQHWHTFTVVRAHEMRPVTLNKIQQALGYYVGYHLMSAAERLRAMPDEAQEKLKSKKYAGVRQEIAAPSIATAWDELFDAERLNSYTTWSSWRSWRWHDEILKQREPHRPSTQGYKIAGVLVEVAKYTNHPKHAELNRLFNKLQKPLKMHDKTDPRHRFDLSELEAVALELIAEARRMQIGTVKNSVYPGMVQALRYQLGLILQLAWRNPMRARNWCEALLGHNLKQDQQGQWRWRFVGEEMKIGMRGTTINVFEPDVPPEVAVHLDEFLASYRPHLKNADRDQHVFLSNRGAQMSVKGLLVGLKGHVNRYTDKHLYTHLLRSLFSTHHLSHGMDINSVAYAMNDTPQAVLLAYNELMADTHRPIIADANRQALANGHKPLTPPLIPITPKPLKTNPEQMDLI